MLNYMYLNEGIQHLVLKNLEVPLVGDSDANGLARELWAAGLGHFWASQSR